MPVNVNQRLGAWTHKTGHIKHTFSFIKSQDQYIY